MVFLSLFFNARVRVVAQQGISDIFPLTFWSRTYKRFLQRTTYSNVDLIHAWGNAMVYAMLKSNAHPAKIIVRPKGLDLSLYQFSEPTSKPLEWKAIVTRSIEKDY